MSADRSKQSKRRSPGRGFLRWHRRIGIALSAVFIVICLTGIALNHSGDFSLHRRTLESDWIYDWYDIEPEGEIIHFPVGSRSLSSLDQHLYFGATDIGRFGRPVGVAELEDNLAVALPDALILLSKSGEVIEVLAASSLPSSRITAIQSTDATTLTIATADGVFQSDASVLEWQSSEWNRAAPVIKPEAPPEKLAEAILRSFRGEGLSWNRVLLDLHSGRFFGAAGKWVADLSAFSLIFLTLSGIFYASRYLRKAQELAAPKPKE